MLHFTVVAFRHEVRHDRLQRLLTLSYRRPRAAERNYVLVQSRLKHLRKVGVISRDAVVDPIYSTWARNRWSCLEQFAQDAPLIYMHDVWAGYQVAPLVLLEKEGLIPVY